MIKRINSDSIALGIIVGISLICGTFSGMYVAHADDISTGAAVQAQATDPIGQSVVATSTDGTGGTSNHIGGSIVTGDASASSTVDNQLNINTIGISTASGGDEPGRMNSSNLTASTSNEGMLNSQALAQALTGDNSVVGGNGVNTISTGNAMNAP